MGFIEESQSGGFVDYVYEMNGFDFIDAVHWVSDVIGKEIIVASVVTLRDSKRSYDEGNQSVQLECPLDEKQILEKIRAKEIDIIIFNGKYQSDAISVCYNLQNNNLVLGFNAKNNVDRATMESEMGLV